jgi:endonuclease YncB( thermonuclease family)
MHPATQADRRRTLMAQRLARWRWARRAVIAGVLLLGLTVVLSHAGQLGRGEDDWSRLDRRPVHVIRAVDGNTLLVQAQTVGEVRVRLVGVAAPEAGLYWSAEARQALASRAEGKDVLLRLEPTQTRDADGAVLALVYPADADDLNIDLIREGHAYADRRGAYSMQPQFEQAESEARQRKRGLWRGITDERMPPWRREWLEAQREKKRERLARPPLQSVRQ